MNPADGQEACLGLCDMDWEQGICLGCGRSEAQIYGGGAEAEAEASAEAAPAGEDGS